MTTLRQDAERLRAMADEVAAITKRIEPHIKEMGRHDLAYNTRAAVGGNCGNLRRAAGWITKLDRELNQ